MIDLKKKVLRRKIKEKGQIGTASEYGVANLYRTLNEASLKERIRAKT